MGRAEGGDRVCRGAGTCAIAALLGGLITLVLDSALRHQSQGAFSFLGAGAGLGSLALAGALWVLIRRQDAVADASRNALRHLEETETRYRTLVETAAIGIARCTADGQLVSFNDAFAGQMGRPRAALQGQSWPALLSPGHRDTFQAGAMALLQGEQASLRLDVRCLRPSGEGNEPELWLDLVANSGGGGGKEPPLLTLMIQDISGRKETEKALRTANTWLETLLDATPAGLVLLSPLRRIELVNRHLCDMLGLEPGKVMGLRADAFLPRTAMGRMLAQDARDRLRQGALFEQETELLRPDGASFWVRVVGRALDVSDLSKGTLWAVIDLTDVKRAGEALEAARAELDAILSAAPSVAYVRAPDAPRFQFVSAGVSAVLGWTSAEITSDPDWWTRVLHPLDADEQADAPVVMAPGLLERLCRLCHRDGHWVWVLDRINPQFAPDGTLSRLVGVWVDVTAQKHLEAELTARTRDLSRSNAELEAFAYVASHDLRQPLRVITGYLSLLDMGLPNLDAEKQEWMELARDGARRMDRMIVDLLEYARLGRKGSGFAAVDMAEVVSLALFNLGSVIGESEAEVVLPPAWPQLRGASHELIRLVQNLVGNAIKYRAPDRPPRVEISVRRDNGHWVFCVADNGIGIAAQDFDRVFGLFQRLHEAGAYEGTGIGLALCKKIVEHHQGRIWVESTPGIGSCFHFTLPAGG